MLVAFDGPKGVGKTALVECTKNFLTKSGADAWATKEPADTPLGNFTRQISETLGHESLACLIAAGRYEHLKNDILPKLSENRIVILDRYILSSLILQRMDNVSVDFILAIHDNIIMPDIQFAVTADEDIIKARLRERKMFKTRFEHGNRTLEEIRYTNEGEEILRRLGTKTFALDNSGNIQASVSVIAKHILETMNC